MRIALICPSLNCGHDGIADHCWRLRNFCLARNHEVVLFGVFTNQVVRMNQTICEPMHDIESVLQDFSPNVISWHVDGRIFGKHWLRILLQGSPSLLNIKNETLTQVMVHETWNGTYIGAPLKRWIRGLCNRRVLQRWLQFIQPQIIHTSNTLYAWQLRRLGFQAAILPMFSNIAVRSDLPPRNDYNSDPWNFAMFGPLYPEWNAPEFLDRLAKLGKQIVIHHIGRSSSAERLHSCLKEKKYSFANLIEHGGLPENEVSKLLLDCHFGISTYARSLINKSSTYAAMVDHGLPVIVSRNDIRFAGFNQPPENILSLEDIPEKLLTAKRNPIRNSLEIYGDIYLKALESLRQT
jgi:glycosyltransferase involved in cell wall biosynthesis